MTHYTRVKDLVTDLTVCAEDTGYDYDFLCRMVDENIADGWSVDEAMCWVIETAHEHDF